MIIRKGQKFLANLIENLMLKCYFKIWNMNLFLIKLRRYILVTNL